MVNYYPPFLVGAAASAHVFAAKIVPRFYARDCLIEVARRKVRVNGRHRGVLSVTFVNRLFDPVHLCWLFAAQAG